MEQKEYEKNYNKKWCKRSLEEQRRININNNSNSKLLLKSSSQRSIKS